jgi:hypothetical protein
MAIKKYFVLLFCFKILQLAVQKSSLFSFIVEHYHFGRDGSDADTNNSRHGSDKDSTIAQASHDSDD